MRRNTVSRPAENKMGVMPENKLLLNMAVPMMLSMLVQALYNVVDSIFVSKLSQDALNAVSLAFPVQNLMIAVGAGTAVGINALLSRSLGQKDQERADKTAMNGILLALLSAVVFTVVGLFGARLFFSIQTDIQGIVDYGTDYLMVICGVCIGIFMQVTFERLLQSTGRTFYSMITQGTGAILNIILDPIFIFTFDMGIAGAAVATVVGQFCAAGLGIFFNLKFNPDVRLSFKNLIPKKEVIRPILTVGIPSVIMVAIGSVMNLLMTSILNTFQAVKVAAVGVFGTYFKLQSFFFMPLFGLNNATISIVAFNFGARKKERITKTLKLAVLTAMGFMLAGLAAFMAIPDVLLGLFEPSEDFLAIGITALRIIALHYPLAAIGISLGASFQALGNGIYSTVVSLVRQMFALIPAAWLLSLAGRVDLVWWSFPIAEVVSAAISIFFYWRIYKQKIKPLA